MSPSLTRVLMVNDNDPWLAALPWRWPLTENVLLLTPVASLHTAEALAEQLHPDVLLLEACPLDAALTALLTQYPTLIIARRGDEALGLLALQGGAAGLLIIEDSTPDDVLAAVCAVRRGEAVLSPRLSGQILDVLKHESQFSKEGGS